jgi:alpha-galactosidase
MRRLVGMAAALAVCTTMVTVTQAAAAEPQYFAAQRVGERPPMGWNSWNKFGCDIHEDLVRGAADALVSSGMKDAGYQYVNIDDCWAEQNRTADGKLEPNHERFPHGIKALADYVHGLGLKLGIYTSAGTLTCAKTMPGALDHEEADAQSFADWGVDYLKYDNCNNQGRPAIERYTKMGDAIKKTGRPMIYALCEWGENDPWTWGRDSGAQLWRTTGDISDNWGSMTGILDQQVGLEKYSGPGGWNDPDMLEVGNGGMTDAEYRSHFSLWALMNAPLLAGNDLPAMSPANKKILENKDVIALDQDWAGTQGHKIRDDGDTEVWAKPMSDGSAAVVLFNRGPASAAMTTTAKDLGLKGHSYRVRDLWSGTETETAGILRTAMQSHGSAVFRVWPATHPAAAPLTTLALPSPDYVPADRPLTATLKVTNDGSTPIGDVRTSVAAPAGWQLDGPGAFTVPVVLPGKSWQKQVTFKPVSPSGDHVTLTAKASYLTLWGKRDLTSEGTSPLVSRPPSGTTALSKAAWMSSDNGWGPVERGTSNGESKAGDGHKITIAGTGYDDGIGGHAPSSVRIYVGAACTSVSTLVGMDDENSGGSAGFRLIGDGKELAATGVMHPGDQARPLSAQLSGVQVLELSINDGGDGNTNDHADWANATITC